MDKSFGAADDPIARAKAKIDTGFALMQALGISYFCFHDVDLVEEADTLRESNRRLDEVSDYLLEKMQETGIRCLWGTCNTFFNKRFMHGAGTSPSADIFAYAAAKIKKAIDITQMNQPEISSICLMKEANENWDDTPKACSRKEKSGTG